MLGLVISLLIIALVVIINDILSYVYIFQGVHRIFYVYRNSVNKRNIICKLLRRFIGIVFFYAS